MEPISTPITGNEDLGDVSRPEHALVRFYEAFNRRDLRLMAENWAQSDDVAMDNPVGGIKRGWNEIAAVYKKIFESESRVTVEFYDYTLHQTAELFYAVGRERGELIEAGGRKLSLQIRTTRLFRKVDARWRQVHHHGSIDDPRLLKDYQDLVLGRK